MFPFPHPVPNTFPARFADHFELLLPSTERSLPLNVLLGTIGWKCGTEYSRQQGHSSTPLSRLCQGDLFRFLWLSLSSFWSNSYYSSLIERSTCVAMFVASSSFNSFKSWPCIFGCFWSYRVSHERMSIENARRSGEELYCTGFIVGNSVTMSPHSSGTFSNASILAIRRSKCDSAIRSVSREISSWSVSTTSIRFSIECKSIGTAREKTRSTPSRHVYSRYSLVPFLRELRTIMDWIFTDTALGLTSWLQLEDIYSNVYLLKCARWAETVGESTACGIRCAPSWSL